MPFQKKKRVYPTRRRRNSTELVFGVIMLHYTSPETKNTRLTYGMLTEKMGWKSRNTAFYHVQKLVRDGKIDTSLGFIQLKIM